MNYTDFQTLEARSVEEMNALVATAIGQGKTPIGPPRIVQGKGEFAPSHYTQVVGTPAEEGGGEPTFIATAEAAEVGGEALVGYLNEPGNNIGTSVANPDDRLRVFTYIPSASISGGQPILVVSILQAEGATGASITIFINDVEIATLTAAGTGAGGTEDWTAMMLPGSPFPTVPEIEAGDTIKAVLSEQF